MVRAGVTDMADCVDTIEEMFELLNRGDYRMAGSNNNSHGACVFFPDDSPFPSMPKNTPDRRLMAMPAYLGGNFGTCGVKWYGSNIANRDRGLPRSILMFILSDAETGAPLAFMSANLISAYRTGAISGVGARHLARRDAKVAGILGPGVMGKTSLSAFMVTCPELETVKVKGRGIKNCDLFIQWVKETYPQIKEVRRVESDEDLVRGSSVIAYCSSGAAGDPSTYPTIKREWLDPGTFVAMPGIGAIDSDLAASNVRKLLDNTGLYEAWVEELPYPRHNLNPVVGMQFMDLLAEKKLKSDDLEDLGRIISGEAPGRNNDDEIFVLSVGGMPVEDVAWATRVYQNAVKQGIGVALNLWDEPVLR